MMAFAVKRILNHTYIAVPEGSGEEGSYGRNVVAANRIPGLLTCRVEHLDGKTMLLFDVTSRQSLQVFLDKRKITADILRMILTGILTAAENLEEFLLDPGHFVLRPEYVFLDAAAKEIGLIYDIGYQGDFYEGLKGLAGGLLGNIPENDHEAILLGYRFCHELDAPARDMTVLLGLLAAGEEPDGQPGDLYAEEPYGNLREMGGELFRETETGADPVEEEKADRRKNKTRRRSVLYAAAAVGGGFSLILLIYAAAVLVPAFPAGALPVLYLALPAAGLAAALIIFLFIRRKRKKERMAGDAFSEQRQAALPEPFSDIYESRENENPDLNAGALLVSPFGPDNDPETRILASPAGRFERTARLIPEDPAAGIAEIRLTGAETRIGKLPEAVDAVISSPVISRIHARIIRRENGWYLEDLNSRNGTYVNGKMVSPGGAALADGDKVRFADAGFVFRVQ